MRFVSTLALLQLLQSDVLGWSTLKPITTTGSSHQTPTSKSGSIQQEDVVGDSTINVSDPSRRNLLQSVPALMMTTVALSSHPQVAMSVTATGSSDGKLPDLPTDAVRSYLQYRIPLQIAADYYVFDLQGMVGDVEQWSVQNEYQTKLTAHLAFAFKPADRGTDSIN